MHRFGNRGEGGTRVAAEDTLACPGITALLVTGTERGQQYRGQTLSVHHHPRDHHGRRPVPRSGPAKENNDALEPPKVCIVSGGRDLKTEIPTKKFLGRSLGINY